MMRNLIVATAFLITSYPAVANFYDGNKLHDFMRDYELLEAKSPDADMKNAFFYAGYVAGISDAYNDLICKPENTQLGQLWGVVAKYLKAHPERWNRPASELILVALQDAYPCPKN